MTPRRRIVRRAGGDVVVPSPRWWRAALVGLRHRGDVARRRAGAGRCSRGWSSRWRPATAGRPPAPAPPSGCSPPARTWPSVGSPCRWCRCSAWPCWSASRGSGRARRWSTSRPTASSGGACSRVRSRPRSVPGGPGMPSPSPVAVALTVAGPFRVDAPLARRARCSSCRCWPWRSRCVPVALDDPDVLGPRLGLARAPGQRAPRGASPASSGAAMLLASARLSSSGWSRSSGTGLDHLDGCRGDRARGGRCSRWPRSLSLANLAPWAVSFLAGPGFRVVEGGAVTWSGSDGRPAADGARCSRPCHSPVPSRGSPPCRCSSSSRSVPSSRGRALARGGPAVAAAHQARGRPGRLHRHRPGARGCSTWWPAARSASSGCRPSVLPAGAARPRAPARAGPRRARRGAPRRLEAAPVSASREPLGLVVLVSGSGSNLQALIDASGRARRPVPRPRRRGRPRRHRRRRAGRASRHPDVRRAGCPTT